MNAFSQIDVSSEFSEKLIIRSLSMHINEPSLISFTWSGICNTSIFVWEKTSWPIEVKSQSSLNSTVFKFSHFKKAKSSIFFTWKGIFIYSKVE